MGAVMNNKSTGRQRGRPIADDAGDNELVKARRRRNREAQHIFRQRRQAVENARANRVRRLEDVVEQMSGVFAGFVDEMMATHGGAVARQCPELVESLRGSTERMVKLAKEVARLDDADGDVEGSQATMESKDDGNQDERDTSMADEGEGRRNVRSSHALEHFLTQGHPVATGANGTSLISPSPSSSDEAEGQPFDSATSKHSSNSFGAANIIADPHDLLEGQPHNFHFLSTALGMASQPRRPSSFFSSGGFDPILSYVSKVSTPAPTSNPRAVRSSITTRLHPTSFLFRLTEQCCISAYRMLDAAVHPQIDEDNFPMGGFAEYKRVFRYALAICSADQLLPKVRWLLGPGRLDMHRAADVYIPPEYAGSIEGNRQDNETYIDGNAMTGGYISALGVQQQLQNLGAKMVAQDTLEICISPMEQLSMIPNTHSSSYAAFPTPANRPGVNPESFPTPAPTPPVAGAEHVGRPPTYSNFSSSSSSTDPRSSDFHGEASSASTGGVSPSEHMSSNVTLTMRLSISLLITNLSAIGVCFAGGPGFPRDELSRVVAASAVMVQESNGMGTIGVM